MKSRNSKRFFRLHASHTLRAMNNSTSRDSVGCACSKCICNSMMRCLDVQLGMLWRGVTIAFSDGPLIKHAKAENFNKCSQICRWWVAGEVHFGSLTLRRCLWRVASSKQLFWLVDKYLMALIKSMAVVKRDQPRQVDDKLSLEWLFNFVPFNIRRHDKSLFKLWELFRELVYERS